MTYEEHKLLHITCVNGEVVRVAKEVVCKGRFNIFVGGQKLCETSEMRAEFWPGRKSRRHKR